MRAGSKLPQFLAVVRPKQGTGASFKQGMIYGKALEMQLRVTFTEKFATVPKERSKGPTASRSGADILPSGQLIWEGTVKGDHTKIGVKGLYLFDANKMGLAGKLVKQGIYYFNFELVKKLQEVEFVTCVCSFLHCHNLAPFCLLLVAGIFSWVSVYDLYPPLECHEVSGVKQ